jgi:hypothetical protein
MGWLSAIKKKKSRPPTPTELSQPNEEVYRVSAPLDHCLSFDAYLPSGRILNQERRLSGLLSVRNF